MMILFTFRLSDRWVSTPVKIQHAGQFPAGIPVSHLGHFQSSTKIIIALYPGEKKLIPEKFLRHFPSEISKSHRGTWPGCHLVTLYESTFRRREFLSDKLLRWQRILSQSRWYSANR